MFIDFPLAITEISRRISAPCLVAKFPVSNIWPPGENQIYRAAKMANINMWFEYGIKNTPPYGARSIPAMVSLGQNGAILPQAQNLMVYLVNRTYSVVTENRFLSNYHYF